MVRKLYATNKTTIKMKKIYLSPSVRVVTIDCTSITAATTEITVNDKRQSEPDEEMFSKKGDINLWDDEEK